LSGWEFCFHPPSLIEKAMEGEKKSLEILSSGKVQWPFVTKTKENLGIKDILQDTRFNFPVEKAEIRADGVLVPDWFVLRRKDNGDFLSADVVSGRSELIQPASVFNLFEQLLHSDFSEMEAAFSLHGGRKVWALAKLKESSFYPIEEDIEDEFAVYALIIYGYDRRTALQLMLQVVRVRTGNTVMVISEKKLNRAIQEIHRKTTTVFSEPLPKLLREYFSPIKKLHENFALLSKVKMSPLDRENVFRVLAKKHPLKPQDFYTSTPSVNFPLHRGNTSAPKKMPKIQKVLHSIYEEIEETLHSSIRGSFFHAMMAGTLWIDTNGKQITDRHTTLDLSLFYPIFGEEKRKKILQYSLDLATLNNE